MDGERVTNQKGLVVHCKGVEGRRGIDWLLDTEKRSGDSQSRIGSMQHFQA